MRIELLLTISVVFGLASPCTGFQAAIRRCPTAGSSNSATSSSLFRVDAKRAFGVAPAAIGTGGKSSSILQQRMTKKATNGEDASEKPLSVALSELGQSFKSRAQKASTKASEADKKSKKYLCLFQACCLYTLFLAYRGFRGFFVLLPAVFRNVYSKLSEADFSIDQGEESSPILTWTTKITVFLLASIVTISYVIGGFLRVVSRFISTVIETNSAQESFEAAADVMSRHETRLSRISEEENKKKQSGKLKP